MGSHSMSLFTAGEAVAWQLPQVEVSTQIFKSPKRFSQSSPFPQLFPRDFVEDFFLAPKNRHRLDMWSSGAEGVQACGIQSLGEGAQCALADVRGSRVD